MDARRTMLSGRRGWMLALLMLFIPGLYGGCNPCGNGKLEPSKGEQCDDGNTTPLDGCSTGCQLETLPSVCNAATVAEFRTASANKPDVQAVLAIASTLHYRNTDADLYQVHRCNEGDATTTWWLAIKATTTRDSEGLFFWRPDLPQGQQAFFVHGPKRKDESFLEYPDYTLHRTASGTLSMLARDGANTVLWPTTTSTSLPGANALSDQVWDNSDVGGGAHGEVGYPSAAFVDWIPSLVAEAQAASPPPGFDSCFTTWTGYLEKLSTYYDTKFGVLGELLGDVNDCRKSLPDVSDCNPIPMIEKMIETSRTNQPPKYWSGVGCTDLDCNRGKCVDADPQAAVRPQCEPAFPTVSDCNVDCGEQCDTETGQCYGTKVLSATPNPFPVVNSDIWRCSGYDCAERGDPFYDEVLASTLYTPDLTVGWCGRLKKDGVTFVTIETPSCAPGWSCNQGSSYIFGDTMPNPVLLQNAFRCCARGSSLPAAFGQTVVINTGGLSSNKQPYTTECLDRPSTCPELCECSGEVGDPINAPVCAPSQQACGD